MVQGTFQSIWNFFGSTLSVLPSAGWLLLGLLGLLLILALVLYALSREGFERALAWFGQAAKWGGGWLGLLALLGVAIWGLNWVKQAVLLKYNTEAKAQYSSTQDPDVGATLQYGPSASYISERTYRRTFTLPPDFLRRLGEDGIGILAPYLQDPSAENVTRLADTFRRSGRDVVFTREVTQLLETPIAFDSAKLKVDLRFHEAGPGGRRNFYDAAYQARYVFTNPLDKPAKLRFVFALPEQNGTLREFSMQVNGSPQPDPDRFDNYAWEQEIAAGGKVTVEIAYKNQGSRSWGYNIGSSRRPIKDFQLNLSADRPVRFLRGALFPTAQRGNALNWELKNVITAQQIELFFPNKESRLETLTKVYSSLPVILLVFVVWAFVWLSVRKQQIEASRLGLAVLGLAMGLGFSGVLQWYAPVLAALILGALLAMVLVYLADARLLALALVSALLPAAFLSGDHSSLLLSLGLMGILLSVLWPNLTRSVRLGNR